MNRPRRHRPRGERGQSMLLAVVGLVVLAIGMYTTYNLSRSVYEKVNLQNAADATAYSLATLEARTFNFMAFVNRAQVANYVQMMEAQSILSNATFIEGITGWGGDVAQTSGELLEDVYRILCAGTLGTGCGAFAWIRTMATAMQTLGQALEVQHSIMQPIVDTMEQWTPRYIQLMTAKNQALFGVATMLAFATMSQLATGGRDIVAANDPDARIPPAANLLSGVNMVSFVSAFDSATFDMLSGRDSADARRARRVMAEVANASRFGTGNADFVVRRAPGDVIDQIIGGLSDIGEGGRGGGTASRVIGPILGFLTPRYVGTTKMVATDGRDLAELRDTGRHQAERSDLPAADMLLAKDIPGFGFRGAAERFSSVRSATDSSEYCRYEKPDSYGDPPPFPFGIGKLVDLFRGEDMKCYDDSEKDMRWQAIGLDGGIQPYFKFAPKLRGFSLEARNFNQPDVWVWLHKDSRALGRVGGDDLRFTMSTGRHSASLDARIGEDVNILPDGINVMARAQVYYHRPGAWNEPPNLFNPFWSARLAPKGAALDGMLADLPAPIANFVSDNALMH